MNLAERRGLRLFVFSAMFFAQGIGWAFMAIEVPAIISAHGMGVLASGTAIAVTVLPFAFKWVWGPIMDAFTIARFGRRRPWIVFAQAMMALSAAALLVVPDFAADFDLLVALMLVHTVFNAMQNVAVDALALDLLQESERGRANGLMYGSKYAGGIAGGLGMATLMEYAGQTAAIATMAAVLGALTLVPLLVRESAGPTPPYRPLGEVLSSLGQVSRLRSVRLAALLMLAHNIAGGLLSAVSPVLFMQHLGWKDTEYGQIAGGPSLVAGFAGSLIAGFVADKIGHRRLAAIAVAALGAIWLGWAVGEPLWTNRDFADVLFIVEPFAQSMMVVALWSVCMDTTTRRTSTTQFALYTSLMNASTLIGTRVLARHVGDWWDYQGIYFAAAAMQLAVLAIVPLIDVREARRELPE